MADHLSDEERLDALKKWWRDNGTSLLVVIILVAGGWFGWNYWQNKNQKQAEEASLVYMATLDALNEWERNGSAEQAAAVAASAETLKKLDEKSFYGLFGAMTIARLAVSDNDLESAANELEWVIEHSDDNNLKGVVTYRLAAIEYSQGNSDRALSLLDTPHPPSFNALYEELKGDILVSKGEKEKALGAYRIALESLGGNDSRARSMLELKISELAPARADTPGVEGEDA